MTQNQKSPIVLKQKVSLTTLVTGLVCLTLIITVTILLLLTFHFKNQSLIETTLNLNSSNANNMSKSMDRLLRSMKDSLHYSVEVLRNYPQMTTDETNQKLELLRKTSQFFNSIALIDETGRFHSTSPSSLRGLEGTIVTSEVAKEMLKKKAAYLSMPFITTKTNRLIVSMSEPIFDENGTYRGYIVGTIYLKEPNVISQVFGSTNIDEYGSYYYVVSSNGYLLYHPKAERIGENVSANPVVNQLVKGQNGKQQVVNLLGVTQLAGYSVVPSTGWGIVVVSPSQLIDSELNQFIKETLFYFIPVIFLSLISAIWLSRRLSLPFISLTKLVNQSKNGYSPPKEVRTYINREADLLATALDTFIKQTEQYTNNLAREALIDPLTGLLNRRNLEKLMKQWMFESEEFTLLIMDIDRFKIINDTYGHNTGDIILIHLAALLQNTVRKDDICFRFGGEEFVVLIKGTPLSEAYALSEKIRIAFETNENPIGKTCTLSLGLAHYPSQAEEPTELLKLADQALYEAKRRGRNQSCVFE